MSREWIISSRRAKSYPLNRLVRAQEAKETLFFEEVDYQGHTFLCSTEDVWLTPDSKNTADPADRAVLPQKSQSPGT